MISLFYVVLYCRFIMAACLHALCIFSVYAVLPFKTASFNCLMMAVTFQQLTVS